MPPQRAAPCLPTLCPPSYLAMPWQRARRSCRETAPKCGVSARALGLDLKRGISPTAQPGGPFFRAQASSGLDNQPLDQLDCFSSVYRAPCLRFFSKCCVAGVLGAAELWPGLVNKLEHIPASHINHGPARGTRPGAPGTREVGPPGHGLKLALDMDIFPSTVY